MGKIIREKSIMDFKKEFNRIGGSSR